MDFTFDETQRDLQTLARTILDDQAAPETIRRVEDGDGLHRPLWTEFWGSGLLAAALPEEVGGDGLGVMGACVLLEEVGRRVAPIPLLQTLCLAGLPLADLGTSDQRKKYLVPIVEGQSILTAALQEGGRHDPLQPSTVATKDGHSWRLDGVKVTVPYVAFADRILVSATINGDATGLFILDPSAPGVRIEPARSTSRQPQGTLVLEGAVVDSDDAIESAGALRQLLRYALAGMCATAVGVLDEAVRITAGYISEREQFGRPIATFQGATLKAADAYIETEAVRAVTWSAIWRLAEGRECDDELAIAKYWVAEGGQNAVHHCQHLHGGMGVDVDYPIHRYFLWAKELELTLGGTNAQLLKIGASIAGAN